MKGNVMLTLREKPDHITIHADASDLSSNMSSEKLAESITELAYTLK